MYLTYIIIFGMHILSFLKKILYKAELIKFVVKINKMYNFIIEIKKLEK